MVFSGRAAETALKLLIFFASRRRAVKLQERFTLRVFFWQR